MTVYSTSGVAGHTTYLLGVDLHEGAANIYSIFGSEENPLIVPAAYQVAAPFGKDVGGTNPALWAVMAETEFDSYLTVGDQAGCVPSPLAPPPRPPGGLRRRPVCLITVPVKPPCELHSVGFCG